MKRYAQHEETVSLEILVEHRCDGCGILIQDTEFQVLFPVAIEVNWGDEAGSRDQRFRAPQAPGFSCGVRRIRRGRGTLSGSVGDNQAGAM